MIVLKNPLKESVKIQIDGIKYSIEAESLSKALPEEVAMRWKAIHGFLQVESSFAPSKETKVAETKEEAMSVEVEAPAVAEEVVGEKVEKKSFLGRKKK